MSIYYVFSSFFFSIISGSGIKALFIYSSDGEKCFFLFLFRKNLLISSSYYSFFFIRFYNCYYLSFSFFTYNFLSLTLCIVFYVNSAYYYSLI